MEMPYTLQASAIHVVEAHHLLLAFFRGSTCFPLPQLLHSLSCLYHLDLNSRELAVTLPEALFFLWLPYPLWLHTPAPHQVGHKEQGGGADRRDHLDTGHLTGILVPVSRGQSLLHWRGHQALYRPSPTSLLPYISLRALEGGFMSSCLRNALKMRITEHFPSSPQFTFSAFSLGCQAFVVIFINSNCWLFPFLPKRTPPLAGMGYHSTVDQPWG